jgi:Stress responsive A/B Barrel Domain
MRYLLPLLLILAFASACVKPQPTAPADALPERVLRHVVLFKLKDGLPQDSIQGLENAFRGLKAQIPTILDFEWGINNSPEGLSQGYTHCFVATFASEKDRDDYLPHPAHQAFVNNFAKTCVDKVCVVDFWAGE